ncbi:tetratricopeptide repeat protein [Geobacter sp. DSM 9736]|uniref:tetratricopeptide repeat protein n=1 Tax=Geobacter sp. DSM 9736 TaxID=1277350 RepID=UPI000B50683D|nr:hypothetical protein [Geobacter sp. DSM 9736]SNB46639.1 Tetratricopeptide repeat-containing protein [Geobacter sp. DSM 9736]
MPIVASDTQPGIPRFIFFRLLPLVVSLAVAAFLVREVVDADTWWQVGIGRDILARWEIPGTDRFSAAGFGRPYHDSHWLFQVLLASADRLAGMVGVNLVMITLWGVILFFCYRAMCRWIPADNASLLLFCVALACSDRFTPRPDLITILMVVLFYLRLQEERYRSSWQLLLFAFLQVIWTNSHGLFVIGPFMAGCVLAGAAISSIRSGEADLKWPLLLFLAVAAASIVSPFGVDGWRYALLLATEAGPAAPTFFKTIAELTPTFGNISRSAPDFWFFLILLLLAAVAAFEALRARRFSLSRLLLIAGLAAAACTGRRNIPLFAVAAGPFIAEHLSGYLRGHLPRAVAVAAAALILFSCWFPLSGRYYRMLNYPIRAGLQASPILFSADFPRFMAASGFSGQLYNSNYLGGYCLYHGIRPLTDGRWEVYDSEHLEQIFSAPGDQRLWEQIVSRHALTGVLLLHDSEEANNLLPRLRNDDRWRLVYADLAVSFWMRADQPKLPPAVDPAHLAKALPQPMRPEQSLMLASFFAATGATEEAIRSYRRTLFLDPGEKRALHGMGGLYASTGRLFESEQAYLALLKQDDQDTAALNELAFLAYRRGKTDLAITYLRQALSIKPHDADLQANYRRLTGGGSR